MSRPRTILQILPYRFLGGPEKQTLNLAAFAKKNLGLTTDLLLYTSPQTRAEDVKIIQGQACAANLKLELKPSPRPWQIFSEQASLRAKLKKYDRLISSGYVCDLLAMGIDHVPKVSVFHGWTGQDLKVRLYEAIDAKALKKFSRIACVSKSQFAILKAAGLDEKNLRWLPNALDPQDLQAGFSKAKICQELKISLTAETRVIGSIGRLSPEKGHEYLIKASASILRKNPKTHLVLIGDGPLEKKLKDLTRQMGLQRQTHFLGFRADAYRYLMGFDIFVLPSLREGLPVVLLEAFAMHTPVLATDVGGVSELVQNLQTGHLVAAKDMDQMTQALQQSLNEPGLAKSLSENAYLHLQKHFSIPRQAQIWQTILDDEG